MSFRIYSLVLLLVLFIFDRSIKLLLIKSSVEGFFIGPVQFFLHLNQGAVFGIRIPLLVLLVVMVVIFWLLIKWYLEALRRDRRLVAFALGLILIGGFSNFLDRLYFKGVIDFISIGFWPVFNLADIYITAGIIILFFLGARQKV